MNWMLLCTAEPQTKDKASIYLSLLPPWVLQGCSKGPNNVSELFNPGRSQCINGTDDARLHLNLNAVNNT